MGVFPKRGVEDPRFGVLLLLLFLYNQEKYKENYVGITRILP